MLTPQQRLQYCAVCHNRKTDYNQGLVCSLSNAKPTFEHSCPSYNFDAAESQRLNAMHQQRVEQADPFQMSANTGAKSKGGKVAVGILMIVGGLALLIVCFLAFEVITFWSFFLIIGGIIALVKAGKNNTPPHRNY